MRMCSSKKCRPYDAGRTQRHTERFETYCQRARDSLGPWRWRVRYPRAWRSTAPRQAMPASAFIAIDHATAEGVGIHATRMGTRLEARNPLRQGVKARVSTYGRGVAVGLFIRHYNGSQYTSEAFQDKLRLLGHSPCQPKEAGARGPTMARRARVRTWDVDSQFRCAGRAPHRERSPASMRHG